MTDDNTKPCQVCGGTGHWLTRKDIQCTACNGTGRVPK